MASYTCYFCQEESSISSPNAIQLECCSDYVDRPCQEEWQDGHVENYCGLCRRRLSNTEGRADPVREQGDLFAAIEGKKLYVQPYKNA